MIEFLNQALFGFLEKSAIELVAVAFALAYLVLAMRQNIWCWACALVSTALYSWIFFDVSLVMESLLNVYYMVMAGYGFWAWTRGARDRQDQPSKKIEIQVWSVKQHVFALAIIFLLTIVTGYLLSATNAAWPYLDSFSTWGAVVTTYMVARKVLENWIYWLFVNSIALFLYIERALYPTALLMILYLILVVIGLFTWTREYQKQMTATAYV